MHDKEVAHICIYSFAVVCTCVCLYILVCSVLGVCPGVFTCIHTCKSHLVYPPSLAEIQRDIYCMYDLLWGGYG